MNVVEIMSRSLNNPFAQKFLHTFFKGNKMPEELYTYVIVRTDMPKIHQAVQAGHAAQEAAKRFGKTPRINNLIYLQVPDKESLVAAMGNLGMNEIDFVPFYEPDYNRGLTAIATDYLTNRKQRDVLKSYQMLWYGEE